MKKFETITFASFFFLLAVLFLFIFLDHQKLISNLPGVFYATTFILLVISFIIVISILIFGKKFYNYSLWLIPFCFVGLLFKINHWEGSDFLLVFGFGSYIIGLIIIAIRTIFIFRGNNYIKYTGFFTSLITAITLWGIAFTLNIYQFGDIISLSGTLLYVILIISLVFTLPSVNYLKWSKLGKRYFYRSIMIPLLFIFLLNSVIFVFPSTYESLISGSIDRGLQMKELIIKEKDGI